MSLLYAYSILCGAFLVLVVTFRWTERLADMDDGVQRGGFWLRYRDLMRTVHGTVWSLLSTSLSAGLLYFSLPPLTAILGFALGIAAIHFGGDPFEWTAEWRRPKKIALYLFLVGVGSTVFFLHLVHPDMGLLRGITRAKYTN